MKTLFICSGNVARSQIAQAYYNYLTNSNDAYSAGINQEVIRIYLRIPKDIIGLMKEESIDMSNQMPKLVDRVMVDEAERIFIMCEKEQCPEYLRSSEKATFWKIKDPHYLSIRKTRKIRNQIKEKVKSIAVVNE